MMDLAGACVNFSAWGRQIQVLEKLIAWKARSKALGPYYSFLHLEAPWALTVLIGIPIALFPSVARNDVLPKHPSFLPGLEIVLEPYPSNCFSAVILEVH